MLFQEKEPKKQTGIAILIYNKIEFQPKVTKGYEGEHFIFSKGKNQPRLFLKFEWLCPKCKGTTLVRDILLKLKSHIEPCTLILGDFNTLI